MARNYIFKNLNKEVDAVEELAESLGFDLEPTFWDEA